MSENSLLANVCIALYPTLNTFLLTFTYLLTPPPTNTHTCTVFSPALLSYVLVASITHILPSNRLRPPDTILPPHRSFPLPSSYSISSACLSLSALLSSFPFLPSSCPLFSPESPVSAASTSVPAVAGSFMHSLCSWHRTLTTVQIHASKCLIRFGNIK